MRRYASPGRPPPLLAHPHAPRSSTGTDFPDSPTGPFSGQLVYTPFLSALEPQNSLQMGLFASSCGKNQAISRKLGLDLFVGFRFEAELGPNDQAQGQWAQGASQAWVAAGPCLHSPWLIYAKGRE